MSLHSCDPEIILLTVPSAEECGLYVTDIMWEKSIEELWNEIYTKFSKFGLLYNVYIAPSKYNNEMSNCYYALVKFYSKRAAKFVLAESDSFFINLKKIRIMKMPRDNHQAQFLKLNSHSVEELIAYYFGFNYWSLEIIRLEKDKLDTETLVKFFCSVKITTRDGLTSEGVGMGEYPLTNNPSNRSNAFKLARKFAVESAKADALSKFVIIELANGKRLMDVNYQRPDPFLIRTENDEESCKILDLGSDPEESSSDELEEVDKAEWIENLSDSLLDRLLDN